MHAKLLAGEPLDRIAGSANEFLCGRELGKYATMVLLRVRPDGEAEYINCGHVRPLRVCGPRLEELGNGNMPVGLIQGAEYACEALRLEPDERVLVVTGWIHGGRRCRRKCCGDARLEASLRRDVALAEVFEELREFTCGRPLEDDCTVLEVRFRG